MRQDFSVSHSVSGDSSATGQPRPSAPDASVARWIQRTLRAEPPRAKSLIVTVWGDALAPHGGSVWLSGLIRLMAPFGINERLVRTSVFRLAQDGWLNSATHGRMSRYRLTAEGMRRFDDAHLRIYARPADDWTVDGTWCWPTPCRPRSAPHCASELVWSGFGVLGPTVFLRPAQSGRAWPAVLDAPGVAEHVAGRFRAAIFRGADR